MMNNIWLEKKNYFHDYNYKLYCFCKKLTFLFLFFLLNTDVWNTHIHISIKNTQT